MPTSGQVQHEQHDVADVERGDEPPDEVGVVQEEERPGLEPVVLEGRQQDGGRRRGREAERQERHQDAGGRRVVGGLRPGDALDGALPAELLRARRQAALDHVREEGRDLRAAGGQGADREAERACPRSQGFQDRRQSSRVIQSPPARGLIRSRRRPRSGSRRRSSRRSRRGRPGPRPAPCRRGAPAGRRSGGPGPSARRCP